MLVWTASGESERPVPEDEDAQVAAGSHWPQVSGGGGSGAGQDWGYGQMLPYAVWVLLAVMQGWLIGSWGSPGALGRSMRDRDAAPKDSHLQTQGASIMEKTISQALQTSAKKRHRKGTAWPARVPLGFRWGPWQVQTIWLGGLGQPGREIGRG